MNDTNFDSQENQLDEVTRRKLMHHFFFTDPAIFPSFTAQLIKFAYIMFGIGLFVLFYFKTRVPTFMISFGCIGIGIIATLRWINPYLNHKKIYQLRPNFDQMNEWLIDDLKNIIKPKAIEILGLDETQLRPENFIIVPYPIFWNTPGIPLENIHRRYGSDGKYAYSVWKVQILALTKHYISLYSCNYDWLNNIITANATNEFFYDDISTIKLDMEMLNYNYLGEDALPVGEARVFKLSNMSGEILTVINDIPSTNASPVLFTNLEKMVQVMRIMLRNRRYGEIQSKYQNKEEQAQNQEQID